MGLLPESVKFYSADNINSHFYSASALLAMQSAVLARGIPSVLPSRSGIVSNAVVTSEIKLKQNKRKTMFCFSEIVLFQFCFSVVTCETKR